MRVLVACEFSGIVRDAFKAFGHDAMSCDLLPTEQQGNHYLGRVENILKCGWDLMIAHPPCTYLTNAGVRHLHDHTTNRKGASSAIMGSKRWVALFRAAEFFNILQNALIAHIAVENPIPHKYARQLIGNYTQLIQPWQFGHNETKATCLWLKNLPLLKPTKVVSGRYARIHRMPPSIDRSLKRSITYQGIAEAMAKQWGGR